MKLTRRDILRTGAAAMGSALVTPAESSPVKHPQSPGLPDQDYTPVITPNGSSLPWKIVDGVKVFHLVAEEVWHEFAPGLEAACWGYNGQVHGPTIEAVEGDRVRIYVTNKLPAATSVHWHGLLLPNGMNGVGGLNQHPIKSGETFVYEFDIIQHGTYMYHSHHDEMTQMALGMMGMIVLHPRNPANAQRVDRDFAIMLSEWHIAPGTYRPNPNEMSDFNILTMNARCFPGTDPLVMKQGERVRIRFGNLSAMSHHPIHIHGHHFTVTGTDGGPLPASAQWRESSMIVPVGTTRDAEFLAQYEGDWAMHCHMTHHVMNQMGHGLPNMIGVNAQALNSKMQTFLPSYMTMGHDGMGGHGGHGAQEGVDHGMGHGDAHGGDHGGHNMGASGAGTDMDANAMQVPENSIAMMGSNGPFDYITMGGMFTIVKIRKTLERYADPGWYEHPEGTVASLAAPAAMQRDGIDV